MLNRLDHRTVASIPERPEYCGHTVNFRTRRKSYKVKKTIRNPQEEWMIFENTHELVVTQQEFDLVQELRKNKCRPQGIHKKEKGCVSYSTQPLLKITNASLLTLHLRAALPTV